ncbi:MAG: hypothetical protein IPF62_11370 [Bacteroidetes bacterium]|jgi:hypothetical protein|nr:hypothetical protein [Bacteroidota bacterium]MBK6819425.1 hypothetical protein [Bacteroidota bacterium]MBK9300126.1 hypothetical protein [Bacteroidota bacterium]
MACTHKFFGHLFHKSGNYGLFPNWKYKTLIIGTFNPENAWMATNSALYFYGRPRNYFWKVLPCFTVSNPIPDPAINRLNINAQRDFLISNKVALTDLLINILDADITRADHRQWIKSFKDADLQRFSKFEWNTDHIIKQIQDEQVTHVYFTRLGTPNANVAINSFENQMRIIEKYCNSKEIINKRLYTPSGQGLPGAPRRDRLVKEWFYGIGNNSFPFIHPAFNILNF